MILSRWLGWDEELPDRAGEASEKVKEKIAQEDVYVDVDDKAPLVVDINERELLAWGQYIDSDSAQHGIYGTAMACQILTTGDSTLNNDFQEKLVKAENWLINEWLAQISGEIDKCDYALILKHAWFLNGLGLVDDSVDGINEAREIIDQELTDFVEDLWGKRNANDDADEGWGRYWYINGDKLQSEDEPNVYSSLIALWSLLQFRDFDHFENKDYWDTLLRVAKDIEGRIETFERRQVGSKKSLLTQAGLCVYILCEYRTGLEHSHLQNPVSEQIASLADDISSLIGGSDELTEGEYEIHLFTTPPFGEDSHRYSNHYIIFVPKPIVGLALLKAGKLEGSPYSIEENHRFIGTAVKTYVNEIGTQNPGFYKVPDPGHAAIGDHVWITRFLHSFSTFDKGDLSAWRLVWHRFRKNTFTNVFAGLLSVALAATAGWITLDEITFSAFIAGVILTFATIAATQLGHLTLGPLFD
jgi:hypothetical protein